MLLKNLLHRIVFDVAYDALAADTIKRLPFVKQIREFVSNPIPVSTSSPLSNLSDYDLYEQVADKIGIERIVREEDIGEALLYPPVNSRASNEMRLSR